MAAVVEEQPNKGVFKPATDFYQNRFDKAHEKRVAKQPEVGPDGEREILKPTQRVFPPAPPIETLHPLEHLIVIPQRRPGDVSRGFAKLFPPLIEKSGVDEETWEGFVKILNQSLALSPALSTFNSMLDLATFVLPSWEFQIAAPIAGAVIQYVNTKNGRVRGNAYLAHANEHLFLPRGMICTLVTMSEYRALTRTVLATGLRTAEGKPARDFFGELYGGASTPGSQDGQYRPVDEDFDSDNLVFPRIFAPPGTGAKAWEGAKYWPTISSETHFVPGSSNDPDPSGILSPLVPLNAALPKNKNKVLAALDIFDQWQDKGAHKSFIKRARQEDIAMEKAIRKNQSESRRKTQNRTRKTRDMLGFGPLMFVIAPMFQEGASAAGSPPPMANTPPAMYAPGPSDSKQGSMYAPSRQGSMYAPAAPQGSEYAPARQESGYAPAPQGSGYAPAPQGSGYAPAPQGSGYAPAPQGSGYAPAPQGSGFTPARQGSGYAQPPPSSAYAPAHQGSMYAPRPQ